MNHLVKSNRRAVVKAAPPRTVFACFMEAMFRWLGREPEVTAVILREPTTKPLVKPSGQAEQDKARIQRKSDGRPGSYTMDLSDEDVSESGSDERDNVGLTPREIAAGAAALLWAKRGEAGFSFNGSETWMGRQRHSGFHPTATISLPGGVMIRLPSDPVIGQDRQTGSISTEDGATQIFHAGQVLPLLDAWQAIQAEAIADTLGLQWPGSDGVEVADAPGNVLEKLAKALGAHVEGQGIEKCTEKYDLVHETPYGGFDVKPEPRAWDSEWWRLGGDVLIRFISNSKKANYGRKLAVVSHPVMGNLTIDAAEIDKALERRRQSSLATALGIGTRLPRHLPMPRGNAQAERILRLCRQAVSEDPEMTDAAGNLMAPLVEKHLPDLMRRHAAASKDAPANMLAGIDDDLAKGLEIVRRTIEQAVSLKSGEKRDALRTQLRFLEMRHPEDDELSSIR